MWNLTQVPKIAHFYWGNKTLTLDRFLSIASFSLLNPDWDVFLHRPCDLSGELNATWNTYEHKRCNSDNGYECYWENLRTLKNLTVKVHNFTNLPSFSEVHRSDCLRWDLLADIGGLWSDLDILYIRPMNELYFNCEDNELRGNEGEMQLLRPGEIREAICISSWRDFVYNSIGFLLSAPKSSLFVDVQEQKNRLLREGSAEILMGRYQSLGSDILNSMFPLSDVPQRISGYTIPKCDLVSSDYFNMATVSVLDLNSAVNISREVVYPYDSFEIKRILHPNACENYLITDKTIGIHWYAGDSAVGKYMKAISREEIANGKDCILGDLIFDFVKSFESDLFPA